MAAPEPNARLALPGDYVVVIHGLAWLRDTLKPTVKHLADEGYQVVRFKYDSRKPLDEQSLAQEITQLLHTECPDPTRRIHFVAHSMGTIVTRSYLQQHPLANLGQVVLLAPPNQGTELADVIGRSKFLQEIFGRGAVELGTESGSLPNRLAPPTYAPGVIMGDRSMFWPTSWMLPGRDDGVIPVERGKLPGMGGFIVLPTNHVRLPGDVSALQAMDAYLQTGTFNSR
jgi:triacylglycerol lipase